MIDTLYKFKQLSAENDENDEKLKNMEIVEGGTPGSTVQFTLPKSSSKIEESQSPRKKMPLISQSILLRILAEIISSYPQCATLISIYTMTNGDTIIKYVMDNLLLNFETGKVKIYDGIFKMENLNFKIA